MRILKVCYAYPPAYAFAGPPTKVKAIAEHLAERGHEVVVLTSRECPSLRSTSTIIDGVSVTYLGCPVRYRWSFTVNPGVWGFARRYLDTFEIVHVYGTHDLLGPVIVARARQTGVPYVIEPLGMYRAAVRSIVKKHAYRRLLGHALMKHAARVVATSDVEASQLIEDGVDPDAIVVRRNGIDLRLFGELPPRGSLRRRVGLTSQERLIVFLGRLTRMKRPHLLLEAFARVRASIEDAHLIFVGPDEDGEMQRLKERAARLGTSSSTWFTGPLYGQEKVAALHDADLFVLPSSSESFGNAAAEALAAGTPVIVTRECGIAPFIGGRAGAVVEGDVTSLADAMQRLLQDDQLRERLGVEAHAISSRLSWDEPVTQLEQVYAEIRRESA